MGFSLDGFVLRFPRTAPTNALTTDEAVVGVDQDYKPLPRESLFANGSSPELVSLGVSQYRSTVLDRQDGQTEYLLWAANTGNLATVEGAVVSNAIVEPLLGSLSVAYEGQPLAVINDGTARLVVRDEAGKSLSSVLEIRVVRGDTGEEVTLTGLTFNEISSVATLDATSLTLLGGGISQIRGDRIQGASYSLAGVRFWWSKNDGYETRFAWNSSSQRWEPLKGTKPRNLGRLLEEGSYSLALSPRFAVGDYLPGNSNQPDDYSMVRIGVRPDVTSTPLAQPVNVATGFGGIRVVSEDALEDFDFSEEPTLSAVVGVESGELKFNPAFLLEYAGQTLFYSYRGFLETSEIESLGLLESAESEPLFLAPIPGPTDYPFIRIGNRTALEAVVVPTEQVLALRNIEEGQVGIAASTGRLKFSSVDLAKADPQSDLFDKGYLGAEVFYDGVSLSQQPLKLRAAVPVKNEQGNDAIVEKGVSLFVPNSNSWPAPGVSGVQFIPDGTGTLPNLTVDPGVRPNGSGLVREVRGTWDLLLFNEKGILGDVKVVDDPEEVPNFSFQIPQGTAYLDLTKGAQGSPLHIGKEDYKRLSGSPLYFLQASVQPGVHASEARLYSRVRDRFDLVGTETFTFGIGDDIYFWDASTNPGGIETSAGGTFTDSEIAQSLNAVITGNGSATTFQGRVVLQSNIVSNGIRYGRVEIGFGPGIQEDISGATALGFLPGWRVLVSDPASPFDTSFLPDNGTHLGVHRSPLNLDGRKTNVADIRHLGTVDDIAISENIPASPVVLLDKVPLEDLPGYDDNIFFRLQTGLLERNLQPYEDIVYQFGFRKFTWADENTHFGVVSIPSLELALGSPQVFPQSLRLPGKGLQVSRDGGPFEPLTLSEDFVLPFDGAQGTAKLIQTIGAERSLGARGYFVEGSTTFSDASADTDFVALGVRKGWHLKLVSGAEEIQGTYIVAENPTQPNELQVSPAFLADGSGVSWQLIEAQDSDTPDPGILADVHYVAFNHLLQEPFKIRTLSSVGKVPENEASQFQSRAQADIAAALRSGRPIQIRFGQPNSSPTATLRPLVQESLGRLVNSLLAPNPTGERYINNNFSIRVGTKLYTFGAGNLIKVSGSLSFPLTGDLIEAQVGSGRLNFGDQVFSSLQGAEVYYVEEFATPSLSPSLLPEGVVEYRVRDGKLNFSQADMLQFGGVYAYFVEQMVTENGQDVTISPIQGSILFNTPLNKDQVVEVEYFQAVSGSGDLFLDDSGNPVKIIEFLPLFVDREVATLPPVPVGQPLPSNYGTRLNFNPEGKTIRQDLAGAIQIYVGNNLANVGGVASPVAGVDFARNQIFLKIPVDASTPVTITYPVNETFGGEQSFTVSTPPVYRPPFRLPSNSSSFLLEGDRTEDMVSGKMLRVGPFPFYVTGASYTESTNRTTVNFFPSTLPNQEPGTLAPGNDILTLLSDRPIAKQYNSSAGEGFWIPITASFEPVNRGFTSIVFAGNLTSLMIAGHLLEVGGMPLIIAGSSLSDDGTRTQVDLTSATSTAFAFGFDEVKVSIRPAYSPSPVEFLGKGAILSEDLIDLVLFGEKDLLGRPLPGRSLTLSTEFSLNFDDGSVSLLQPQQRPLQPGQTLYLRHTKLDVLGPFLQDGVVVYPRYLASYTHALVPSQENGLQGQILKAKYTFSNPDTWYFRVTPMLTYLAEVGREVAAEVAARLPSRGPVVAVPPAIQNQDQGSLGLRGQIQDLKDKDRAARIFLEFYNDTIVAFEQVLETISGDIVGDRDGKLKFFVGRDNFLTPPGYENPITGDLNSRNIFAELFFAYNRSLVLKTGDPLVDPSSATLSGDSIVGDYIDPDLLEELLFQQKALVLNDIDDTVLVGRTRKKLRLNPFRLEAFGRYRRLGEPSRFSRLFPESGVAFTLTDPGIGANLDSNPVDPGVYSFLKVRELFRFKGSGSLRRASTFFKPIGDIGNPVLGQITGITGISVTKRYARARVFSFSPVGFPDLDPSFSTNPRPAVIATVLPLQSFPVRDDGLPDTSLLIANGGELPDLSTGDPDLLTPAFSTFDRDNRVFPQVTFGRPNGDIVDIVSASTVNLPFGGASVLVPKRIFVGEVLQGCILTFVDDSGNPITDAAEILQQGFEASEAFPLELERGDTVFLSPPQVDISAADPPTNAEKEAQAEGMPNYRVGFDVRVDSGDGEYVDISMPSIRDPLFPLKEIFGQHTPAPMTYLEADVRFRNALIEPAQIPALTGGHLNDDGDYTLPYLNAGNTELDRLGEAKRGLEELLRSDSPEPAAVYPDEFQNTDGRVLDALNPASGDQPAALLTAENVEPVALNGYTPNSGVGDVRPFDLLLIEAPQSALDPGATGILSVGYVEGTASGSHIEPPRFVTPAALGSRVRYSLLAAMAFVDQPSGSNPPGMIVTVSGAQTIFDISTISSGLILFNDGNPGTVGGLNNIVDPGVPFAYPNNRNVIRLNLWTAANPVIVSPNFIGSIEIRMNGGVPQAVALFSGLGAQAMTVQPGFDLQTLTVTTAAPFVTVGFAPGDIPANPLDPSESVPLWFTIDVDTSSNVGVGGASLTAAILEDRLTFQESYDLRSMLSRDSSPVDGVDVHGRLSVEFVEGPSSDDITVNAPGEVNGGQPFTFLDRRASSPHIGSFEAGVGQIRVMGYEGFGNVPISSNGSVVFSAIPSSNQDESGPIATGVGVCETALIDPDYDFRVVVDDTDIASGSLENVEPGDILIIPRSESVSNSATTKAGTYLVRHSVSPDAGQDFHSYLMETRTSPSNTQQGWLQVVFPTLETVSVGVPSVQLSTAEVSPGIGAWPATGRLYFIVNPADISQTISVGYTSYASGSATFDIDLSTAQDANGVAYTVAEATALLEALPSGILVSGFWAAQIRMDRAGLDLPRNLVGYRQAGPNQGAFGVRSVQFSNPKLGGGTATYTFAGGDILEGGTPAGPDEIRVREGTAVVSNVFVADEDAIVYPSVPSLFFFELSGFIWNAVHSGFTVNALFPGDVISLRGAGGTPGFHAQAGVFLEPSIPTPVFNLDGPDAHVVDATHSLNIADIGFRSSTTFGAAAYERVFFEVRRIRRFHVEQDLIGTAMQPLRYAYEIRQGTVADYGAQLVPPSNASYPFVVESTGGTQLGGFDDTNVNINPGDLFRLLDSNGNLLEEVEIAAIVDANRLLLKPPGITSVPASDIPGMRFEVYLRSAPVPHQQSNEQLLEQITDQTLLRRQGSFVFQQGGWVPVEFDPLSPRRLKDTDSSINYATLGIQEGDILVIDPAGPLSGAGGLLPLTGQEYGIRPFGDRSVPNRTVASAGQEVPFVPGGPSEFDDNRGFYRIDTVEEDALVVDPSSEFTGSNALDFVTFGTTAEFAVYPTVSGSLAHFASSGAEGQNDLRPTAFAGDQGSPANSYSGNLFSIAPLSYRVIRPSPLFSEEAIDLVLMMRERALSFIEEMRSLFEGRKSGSYYVFQRDLHISDLGNPLVPDEGLGVLSNEMIEGVAGVTQVSPFANASDCLSVLDRRFWVADTRLDSERPYGQPAAPTYSTFESNSGNPSASVGDGRPVLPDLITDVLDNNDQFRPLRYSWISYRVNRETGTLIQVSNAESDYPKQRRNQIRQLKQAKSLEDAES